MPRDPIIDPTLEHGHQGGFQAGYHAALDVMNFAASHDLDVKGVVVLAEDLHNARMKWGDAAFAEFLALLDLAPKKPDAESAALEEIRVQLLASVDELELSVRTATCIQNASHQHVYELVLWTEVDWLKTKNFGRKSLRELREVLQAWFGLPDRVNPFGIELHEGVVGTNRQAVVDALADKIAKMRQVA